MPPPPALAVDHHRSPFARLVGVPSSSVVLTDSFWAPRRESNRLRTVPGQYQQCESTHRIDNFRVTSGRREGKFEGQFWFNDSDVYKWLEAAAYVLATDPDPALSAQADAVIDELAAAQRPDGYLNTYYSGDRHDQRYTNLKDMHELYCAGHLLQAAVAHFRATGKRNLLDIAIKVADHTCDTFGPSAEGKLELTDGHEEIEMALVELYRATGNKRYLDQARFFIDIRGHKTIGGGEYHQDHLPVRDMPRLVGHAVRAVYYMCGVADLYAETGEPALLTALERLWTNLVTRQLYISGGIGSRYEGESLGRDLELPSERAYTETCAAIGSVMWAQRMLALAGEAKYADLIEHTLYNAVLPGISLSGDKYFYQNPLADDGTHRRQDWFGCACCPPNVARLLAYLPSLFYSVTKPSTGNASPEVYVHLYAAGTATLPLPGGATAVIRQETDYPGSGTVRLHIGTPGTLTLRLRIPGWADGATLMLNGQPYTVQPHTGQPYTAAGPIKPGTYATVTRNWKAGDVLTLDLPMPPRWVASHPHAAENTHRLALLRGPLLYCVESHDLAGQDPRDLQINPAATLTPTRRDDLLGGITTLTGTAHLAPPPPDWQHHLYLPTPHLPPTTTPVPIPFTAIPYYTWANRPPARMQVWLSKQT